MTDSYEFFEQLRRGTQPPSESLDSHLHRIPHDKEAAVGQVRRLLSHAVDEIWELVHTVGNIIRWHGGADILPGLSDAQRELLRKLREIAPDEVPEE